jgi:hypothetical protein
VSYARAGCQNVPLESWQLNAANVQPLQLILQLQIEVEAGTTIISDKLQAKVGGLERTSLPIGVVVAKEL